MHDPSFQRWAQTGESIIPFENAALVLGDKYLLQSPVKHSAAVIPMFCVTCCKFAESNGALLNICETWTYL